MMSVTDAGMMMDVIAVAANALVPMETSKLFAMSAKVTDARLVAR